MNVNAALARGRDGTLHDEQRAAAGGLRRRRPAAGRRRRDGALPLLLRLLQYALGRRELAGGSRLVGCFHFSFGGLGVLSCTDPRLARLVRLKSDVRRRAALSAHRRRRSPSYGSIAAPVVPAPARSAATSCGLYKWWPDARLPPARSRRRRPVVSRAIERGRRAAAVAARRAADAGAVAPPRPAASPNFIVRRAHRRSAGVGRRCSGRRCAFRPRASPAFRLAAPAVAVRRVGPMCFHADEDAVL